MYTTSPLVRTNDGHKFACRLGADIESRFANMKNASLVWLEKEEGLDRERRYAEGSQLDKESHISR
jgi:hypothetical protein